MSKRGARQNLTKSNVTEQCVEEELVVGPIESAMIEPISRPGRSGYVPLCCALHWIMSLGGSSEVRLDDAAKWESAVQELLPLLQTGEMELIGIPTRATVSEQISGTCLAAVRVIAPLSRSISDIFVETPHVACSFFGGQHDWLKEYSDRLYIQHHGPASWTHLQVRKQDVLKRWPRPAPDDAPGRECRRWLAEQMEASRDSRPKPKVEFWAEAKTRMQRLSKRQFDTAWSAAINDTGATAWMKAGPTAKSDHRTQVKS